MIQRTSTNSKVNTKIASFFTLSNKKSSNISFRLKLPGFRQDNQSQMGDTYIVELSCIHSGAFCPSCGHFSKNLKGHYTRRLQGLEILNHPLTLLVRSRKYRCNNPCCSRLVFNEALSGLASSYSRNTLEVEKRIDEVSLKTTSRIASELLRQQNIIFSSSSCLRRLAGKAFDKPSCPAPVVVGIDDFSTKKGQSYASVIVDQLTHRPVTILPCREGTELEQYLMRNPQIQYITRDRGRCFIDAINRCLPGATQLCDRFHLIKNMVDALMEEMASCSQLDVRKQTYSYPSVEKTRAKIMEALLSMGDARHRRKLNLFIEADNCIRKGMSISETACKLGEHSQVIWRLVRHHTRKDYMTARQRSILKHIDELAFEVSHGCVNLKKLQEKMKNKIDASDVAKATVGIRNEIKHERNQVRTHNKSVSEKKHKNHASVKAIRHFILNGESEVESLKKLLEVPDIKYTIELCREFREMVNGNIKQRSLEKWISKAMETESQAMRKFAAGIKADQQAVQNAMDIYLNNGLLEGTVNKIKAIKRQMFNRASITLLNTKMHAFKT